MAPKYQSSLFNLLAKPIRSNALFCLALLLGVLLPWLVSYSSGNLFIPHNDAWSHSKIAQIYGLSGQIQLQGWNRSALVGQIFILGPFSASIFIQQTFVTFMAGIALVSIYSILKFYLNNNIAGFAVLLITIFPGFGLLATSFMADIPMVAAIFMSIALAKKALTFDSKILLLLAYLAGIWGVTIREQAIAAFVAIFITFFTKRSFLINIKPRLNTTFFALGLLIIFSFEVWRSNLPGADPPEIGLKDSALAVAISSLVKGWFNLSLIVGIAALLVIQKRHLTPRFWFASTSISVLGLFFWFYPSIDQFFLPNYLSINGAYSQVLSPTLRLFSIEFWLFYVIIALIIGSISFGLIAQSKLNIDPILTWFSLLTLAGTFVQLISKQIVFDRYFIVFLPWALLTILFNLDSTNSFNKSFRLIAVSATFSWIWFLSSLIFLNSIAFDKTRWEIASNLTRSGISSNKIDAGLEWIGWHSESGASYRFIEPPEERESYWSFNLIFGTKPCYVLSNYNNLSNGEFNISKNWKVVNTIEYQSFYFFGSRNIYLYQTQLENC